MSQQQFENFTASSLYCEKCKAAMRARTAPVDSPGQGNLRLPLAHGCGSSVASVKSPAGDKMMAQARAPRRPRRAPVQRINLSACAFCLSARRNRRAVLRGSRNHASTNWSASWTQPDKPVGPRTAN